MPEATFEILSLLMRYVFAALGVLIALTALRWLLREHRVHSREQRQLPTAGQIGVLEFADSGERLPLTQEGLVGAGASCDVVIRRRGLKKRHFAYRFQPRRGVEIIPCRGARVTVNGQKARAGQFALSGALIEAGEATFRLRLYKRLRLPAAREQDSPTPILSTWEEDDFLPNGMAVPMPQQEDQPGTEQYAETDAEIRAVLDGPPDEERGKLLRMPLFSDDPPDEEEK